MADRTNFSQLSDQELVHKIKENSDYLGVVYKKCKDNSVKFMIKMTSGTVSDYELEDVFQDAIIVLYEKIVAGNFELTASFQTYLNSVCRNQLLNKYKESQKTVGYEEQGKGDFDEDNDDNPMGHRYTITDSPDDEDNSNEPQFVAIEKALVKMKIAGSHCYELLSLFWYHKKSHDEIADIMNYTDDKNSKNQKSRCQEKLRVMTFNELNN